MLPHKGKSKFTISRGRPSCSNSVRFRVLSNKVVHKLQMYCIILTAFSENSPPLKKQRCASPEPLDHSVKISPCTEPTASEPSQLEPSTSGSSTHGLSTSEPTCSGGRQPESSASDPSEYEPSASQPSQPESTSNGCMPPECSTSVPSEYEPSASQPSQPEPTSENSNNRHDQGNLNSSFISKDLRVIICD